MPTPAAWRRSATVLIAGLISAAAFAAPAYAEGGGGGIPGEPFPIPSPGMETSGGIESTAGNGCQGGEQRVDGNCVPAQGGVPTSTTGSYVNPMETLPNINGTPCTGAWESTVCLAEDDGGSPPEVQPRSSLSSSP